MAKPSGVTESFFFFPFFPPLSRVTVQPMFPYIQLSKRVEGGHRVVYYTCIVGVHVYVHAVLTQYTHSLGPPPYTLCLTWRCHTEGSKGGLVDPLRPPLNKSCFLSSGWPKLQPLGQPQFFFFFSFFSLFFFFLFGKKSTGKKLGGEKSKIENKSFHSALICSPGCCTGNNIFSKGGLRSCDLRPVSGTK